MVRPSLLDTYICSRSFRKTHSSITGTTLRKFVISPFCQSLYLILYESVYFLLALAQKGLSQNDLNLQPNRSYFVLELQ